MIKKNIRENISKIAETHFLLRPLLVKSLESQIMSPEGKKLLGGANTYYEYWISSLNDKFYDMGTFIRLATEIESSLKYYYMSKKGYSNLAQLKNDTNYEENIFQRIMPWTQKSALDLYKNELKIDLRANSKLIKIQELMLCRHLYAHNSGILNDKFIRYYNQLTGIDLLKDSSIGLNYPNIDVYYFDPLKKLNEFIEAARNFITELP